MVRRRDQEWAKAIVLDSAAKEFALRIKEAIHIKREKSSLNSQVKHINFKLSYIILLLVCFVF